MDAKDQAHTCEDIIADVLQPGPAETVFEKVNELDIKPGDNDMSQPPLLPTTQEHRNSALPRAKDQQLTASQSVANEIDIDKISPSTVAETRSGTTIECCEKTSKPYQRQTEASEECSVCTNFENVSTRFCVQKEGNSHRHTTINGSRTIDVGDGVLHFHEIVGHFHEKEDTEHNTLVEDHERHYRVHPQKRKQELES